MYLLIDSDYDIAANINLKLLALEEIRFLVDTTNNPVSILLPSISDDLGKFLNLKIYVTDISGTASGNGITIVASGSDSIAASGSTFTLLTDNESVKLEIATIGIWQTYQSGAAGIGARTQLSVLISVVAFELGTYLATPAGGSGGYTYQWLVQYATNSVPRPPLVISAGDTTNTVSLNVITRSTEGLLVCKVTDSAGNISYGSMYVNIVLT